MSIEGVLINKALFEHHKILDFPPPSKAYLLHRNTFSQISWLIDITA